MSRPRYELWGESVRELGVLILVFVPLDILVDYFRNGQHPDAHHWWVISVFALTGVLLMVVGVELERR